MTDFVLTAILFSIGDHWRHVFVYWQTVRMGKKTCIHVLELAHTLKSHNKFRSLGEKLFYNPNKSIFYMIAQKNGLPSCCSLSAVSHLFINTFIWHTVLSTCFFQGIELQF